MSSAADCNLLIGILALQMDFVSRDELIAAMNAWVLAKDTPLGEILIAHRALSSEECELLEALVVKHLARHDGDPKKSLAAIGSIDSFRGELTKLADPDIQASLIHLADDRAGHDPYATQSVGTPTSAGARFRVLRSHARGGLGEVFVAQDEELRREVALKQIQSHRADHPESRTRFILEAEITGGLEHPGIVPVYGLGAYSDGRPFYAMRFIRGDSMSGAIERFHVADSSKNDPGQRTLQLRMLLGRFVDVCDAIEYAHSRGILHRDLKPGNIMLGKYGETLVVDWGLAKPIDRADAAKTDSEERTLQPASAGGSTPTQMGAAVGTPQYMSPEQAAGQLDRLGPPSDVYSLGATLYCLLTGKAPLSDQPARCVGEILRLVTRGEIPRPRQIKPDIPRPLEAICVKAMSLKPDERYGSPRALADDIEHWLADEPIAAKRDTISERITRFTRRNRGVARAAAAALLLIAAVAVIAALLINQQRRIANEQHQFADQQRRRADEQSRLALETLNSVVFDIQNDLSGVPGAQEVRRRLLNTAVERLKGITRTLKTASEADRATMVSHIALGDTLLTLGGSGDHDRGTEKAHEQYQVALAIGQQLASADPSDPVAQRDLSVAYEKLGDVNLQLGKVTAARDAFQSGMEISERLALTDPDNAMIQRDLSAAYSRLGDVNMRLAKVSLAKDAFQKSFEIILKRTQVEENDLTARRDLSVSYSRLGAVNEQMGDMPAARDAFQKSLDISLKLAQAEENSFQAQRDLAKSYGSLGDVILQLDDVPASRAAYQKSLDISLKLAQADPNNPQTQRDLAISYGRLCDVNRRSGDAPDAGEACQKGLDISLKLAQSDPTNAQSQRDLSAFYEKLGDVDLLLGNASAARDAYQKRLTISEKLVQSDSDDYGVQTDLASIYGRLAAAASLAEEFTHAARWLERGVKLLEKLDRAGKISAQPLYQGWLKQQRDLLQSANCVAHGIEDLDLLLRQPAKDIPALLAVRSRVLAKEGRYADATATADRLAALDPKNGENLFHAAEAYALCSANPNPDAAPKALVAAEGTVQERYAQRAIEFLKQAQAAGYFHDHTRQAAVPQNHNLDSLRNRDDFKKHFADGT